MTDKEFRLGKAAYQTFVKEESKNLSRSPPDNPMFEDLPVTIQMAWIESAKAVRDEYLLDAAP